MCLCLFDFVNEETNYAENYCAEIVKEVVEMKWFFVTLFIFASCGVGSLNNDKVWMRTWDLRRLFFVLFRQYYEYNAVATNMDTLPKVCFLFLTEYRAFSGSR